MNGNSQIKDSSSQKSSSKPIIGQLPLRLLSPKKLTFAQVSSDWISKLVGSWKFIFGMLLFMSAWMSINVIALTQHWDPYPYILLNFVLSTIAALQAPIILMSQRRTEQRDRLRAKYNYDITRKAERGIRTLQSDIDEIKLILMPRNHKSSVKNSPDKLKNVMSGMPSIYDIVLKQKHRVSPNKIHIAAKSKEILIAPKVNGKQK